MLQPDRHWSNETYRYGYAGQERADEISGTGNHNTALFWEYDTRTGRRWNRDPKPRIGISDYACFDNNPIWYTDILGDVPTPREAAAIAAHVYGGMPDNTLLGGWTISKREFNIEKNSKNGLKSEIYERTTDGVAEYVYATAGTEDGIDALEDLKQPFGMSKQYVLSMENAYRISENLGKNTELTFTGHSLGGGEAAANAYKTGRNAITFNAAGVGPATLLANGPLSNAVARIDAYILLTDPLNGVQNNNATDLGKLMPDVNGLRHYLLPRDWESVYNGHAINNVQKALEPLPPATYNPNVIRNMDDLKRATTIWMNWDLQNLR